LYKKAVIKIVLYAVRRIEKPTAITFYQPFEVNMKKLSAILKKTVKTTVASVFSAAALAITVATITLPAQAATYQDLWSTPAEPGWGVNIAQQGNIIFATWFVYGTDNRPVWYVMSAGQKAAVGEVFTGVIYELRGTYLGVPWQGAQILAPDTGSATFTFTDKKSLTLRYTINGLTVQKNIFRQTFAALPVNGVYYGGETGTLTQGCNPGGNYFALQRYNINVNFPVGTTVGPLTMQSTDAQNVVCNYSGTAEQFGSQIEIRNGQFVCTNNSSGAFSATDGVFNEEGFLLKPTFVFSNACSATSKMGGARQ
jgi:hypothetical protein